MFFGTCARMIHRCDTSLSFSCSSGSSLKIHIHRVCVHPLRLSKQEECAEPNAVDSSHQVENRNPGASGLNQVSSQVHTNDTCREEKHMQRLWAGSCPLQGEGSQERMSERMKKSLYLVGLHLYLQPLGRKGVKRNCENTQTRAVPSELPPTPSLHAGKILIMESMTALSRDEP